MQGQSQFLSKNNYFFKMHGTGNDFIIVNGLEKNGLITSKDQFKLLAQKLCHRKFGIGADGLLIVRKQHETYKMVVINSDGSEPNMCGNGLRCFVSLLYHLKMIPNEYNVLTDDGQKSISVARSSNQDSSVQKIYIVTLKIGSGGNIQSFPDQKYSQFYKTTIGVPHVVIYLTKEQFQTTNFQTQGREIQSNFDANINFCLINSQDSITIKTYERGAGMTYSCGTGVSSSIYVAVAKGKVNQRTVKAQTDGGQIVIELTQAFDVIMKGPAEIICEGQFRV